MKLQTQFTVFFIPLFILSGGGMTYFARKAIHKAILEEEVTRGQAKLEEVASSVVPGLEDRREDLLLPILTAALTKQGALYVLAVDPTDRVLAHTDVTEKDKRYDDPISQAAAQSATPTFHELKRGAHPVLDISWPVWGRPRELKNGSSDLLFFGGAAADKKRLGTLRMGFSLQGAYQTERKILGQLAVLLLTTDCVLLGLVFLLMRGILRQVERFVRGTDDITAGVYGKVVPEPSATELRHLAQSFNRMSQALQQTTVSKDFLNDILANMLEPLIIVNTDYSVRMVNRAALMLLNYGPQELIGKPAALLCESINAFWNDILSVGRVKDREVLFKTKEGKPVEVLFSGSAFTDTEGRPTGFIIVAKDIRDRKKLEADILQSEKLSAVGRLASGVAHEINNPLGVILGFAQGALFDLKPGDALEFPLKSIEREALRCKNLVQDLLTFSRVSKSEREPIDLNKAVEGACSLVAAQARVRKAELTVDLAPQLPRVLANLNQIQQIVINLANNGLDAMKQGGSLTVKTEALQESPESWVVISVTDTGSGIPPEILPRIFEPFFTTKPIGQGTGLGLGLVHEIIKKHSGKIEVESRPGQTRFRVMLPAAAAPPVLE